MEEDQGLIRPQLRPLYFFFGGLAFILGAVGAFLPVLPTTPFLILSAYFFSKSSPKLHQWLLSLPSFGPLIQDWEDKKVIRPRAKFAAILLLSVAIGYVIFFTGKAMWLKLIMASIWICVSLFIYTRNSR
ncbi:MAG: YbaN family protein [Bacteriovoracaceae bacterium]|nr:YbaN family protein [Bacteriovoracaceae bacterium]